MASHLLVISLILTILIPNVLSFLNSLSSSSGSEKQRLWSQKHLATYVKRFSHGAQDPEINMDAVLKIHRYSSFLAQLSHFSIN